MKAAFYIPPQKIEIQDIPIPKIKAGEILLKVKACGICGTDLLKVQRRLPQKALVLGHEIFGEIVELGESTHQFKIGDRVAVAHHVPCGSCHYCFHGNPSMCADFKMSNVDPGGFAEYLRIPAEHVRNTTFLIPEHVTPQEAIFIEPLACCVRNIRRASLQRDDFVVMVGAGSVGLMTLQLLKLIPVQVMMLDLIPERLEIARKMGANLISLGNDERLHDEILAATEGRGADLVILSAGNGKTIEQAFNWIRPGGALNLFASLSSEPIPLSVDAIYHREITIFSSYSPALEDLKTAHQLICDQKVHLQELVTHQLPLEGLSEGLQLMQKQQALKVVLEP